MLVPAMDPDPAETARRDVELVEKWEEGVVGVAGWTDHGWKAVRLASDHPEVERLALLAVPIPEVAHVSEIAAKTLLLFGAADDRTGSRALDGGSTRSRTRASRCLPAWDMICSHPAGPACSATSRRARSADPLAVA